MDTMYLIYILWLALSQGIGCKKVITVATKYLISPLAQLQARTWTFA